MDEHVQGTLTHTSKCKYLNAGWYFRYGQHINNLSIAVSSDQGQILYTQVDQEGSDIMLVENFR